GDVNGDGFDDLIIGAPGAEPVGNNSGSSYVVFGGDFASSSQLGIADVLDLSDGVKSLWMDGSANEVAIGGGRTAETSGESIGSTPMSDQMCQHYGLYQAVTDTESGP